MSKVKVFFIALALVITSAAAFAYYNFIADVPLPGKTIASPELQQDTIFAVGAYGLRIATKNCFTVQITNTEVSKPKKDNKWEEIWTLKVCERVGRLPIEFTINEDGTGSYALDYMNIKWKTIGQTNAKANTNAKTKAKANTKTTAKAKAKK